MGPGSSRARADKVLAVHRQRKPLPLLKRTSAGIVSTCESTHGGEGLFLKSNLPRVSTWKHQPARPYRKMLWDLIPVDNDRGFYIVSNADSRAPNETLFLNDPGGLASWPFQEDRQAQWFLKRAPVPESCYEEPWCKVLMHVGIGVSMVGGEVCCKFCEMRFSPSAKPSPH